MFVPVPPRNGYSRGTGPRRPPRAFFLVVVGATVAVASGVAAYVTGRFHGGVPSAKGLGSLPMGLIGAIVIVVVAMVARQVSSQGEDQGDDQSTDDARDAGWTRVGGVAEESRPITLAVMAALAIVAAIVAALVLWPRSAASQGAPVGIEERGALVMIKGNDTVVVDRFVRNGTALQGSVRIRGGPRQDYYVVFGPGELVQSFTLSVWAPGAAVDAPPAQRIPMTVHGDTIVAQTPAGTQRVPTRYGAIPVINNSLALVELFTRRARASGGSEFPWFATAGGATVSVSVTPLGADSLLLTVANQPHRLAVDAVGRITGGLMPSTGIRIARLGADAASGMTLTPPPAVEYSKPDYSAPPDAPYTAEDVSFAGPKGIRLGGTLTVPKGAGPFAAVVTITGSGQQDRDEFIPLAGGVRLFRQVADTLSRRGIAVLRVDDRGLGASGGDATTSTSSDFADDTRAAVAYLRSRHDIDGARVGLIGHSEGGMIAPMVAATDPALRAMIILAGPASMGSEISKAQNRYAIDHMPSLSQPQKDSLYAVAVKQIDATKSSTPWITFWMSYDPAVAARKVKAATLIVQGATDRQVPMTEAEKLAAIIRAGGNRDVTVRVLPDVNHLFLADPDGNFENYDKLPSNRIVADALGVIADWSVQKLSKQTPKP